MSVTDRFADYIGELPRELKCLRQEVREFLASELKAGSYHRGPSGWEHHDADFSRKIGARGWIGMTWPRRYGGHGRSALERYVVTEELLTAGAPVKAHWQADRQIGPLLLKVGTEDQKLRYLPRIVAGECFICVGLSEPDSGSDLASIRTKAEKVPGGWRIEGRKVWTSYAHRAHMIDLFARTSPRTESNRRSGVTQFLVDMDSPGISVRPIPNLAGEHDFNEITFDGLFATEDSVIGSVDGAWSQVSGELSHAHSGPERWLSTFGLLIRLIDQIGPNPDALEARQIGRLIAHLWTLQRMSFVVAALLEQGASMVTEAALVKDLGAVFEQEIPQVARELVPQYVRTATGDDQGFEEMLDRALLYAPSFTIRAGTKEILRGIIARSLGLR